MCGRFALRLAHDEIEELNGYHVQPARWIDRDNFVPRYNIAPRTQAPVVRRAEIDTNELVLQTMKWGLVPHWSKFEDKSLSTTNARSENLIEGGGMWASIKGRKRCAVICQGYYEWLAKGKDKLPHFTKYEDGKLMLMAGLYDEVILEGQTEKLSTFTIVTTSASKDFSWLHERQPVFLSTNDALERWLDTSSQQWSRDLEPLLAPFHDTSRPLECYPVPMEVGRVGTESSTFIEPLSKRKDGIQAMFSKQTQAAKTPLKTGPGTPATPVSKRKHAPSWDEDNEIEIIDAPSRKKVKTKAEPSSAKKTAKSKSPQKKPTKDESVSVGTSKITSFFSKP